jgi:DNA-3-methyladenine glycosylase I
MKKRCEWAYLESMHEYHDQEWCVPVHDDRKLFEMLILEGAQAGLTWQTILKKREGYRKAFHNFDAEKIAKFSDKDVERLMKDSGIVRNRLKIQATIINAKKFLDIQREFGSFDKYIWKFVNGKVKKNNFKNLKEIPASTSESDAMSKDLKNKGFKFVGTTICYAFMQAVGMVNDHQVDCFRYNEV